MKTKSFTTVQYICDICGHAYGDTEDALSCESKPISEDKGVNVGDLVVVTGGEGKGCKAKVTKIGICDKYYANYSWKRYWHTVWITADLIDEWGTRMLLFDQYEVVK